AAQEFPRLNRFFYSVVGAEEKEGEEKSSDLRKSTMLVLIMKKGGRIGNSNRGFVAEMIERYGRIMSRKLDCMMKVLTSPPKLTAH
ncbi:MAG: hypothetical protein R3351_02600, partial [Nitrospirales bacterium]|nr:hypothetical protein [Nitrospirales bacterium]